MKGKERLKMRYSNEQGLSVYLGNDAPFIYLSQTGLDGMNGATMLLKSPY